MSSDHLTAIVERERRTPLRDALFAVVIAIMAGIAVSSLTTASHVVSGTYVAQR
jgi:hypothetical protein